MKKTLLLLASAAMLLVGCAKEQLSNGVDGGMTSVTFSASVDGGVATKASADLDGKGDNVNRCIMEIYFQDQLYKRMEAAMSETPATATFANVPVVAGKEYQILFWADCVDDAATAEGLEADKYYTTTSLKAVTVAKAAFIGALEAGDNDKLDAFCFAGNYTVPQNPTQPFTVVLKRPFAQLNVITTDVAEGKTVTSEDLLPEKVSVSYKADNILNVATGETSRSETEADYTFTYEASVYGAWDTITEDHQELTLSMDYILASTEQGNVDVTFVTKNGGQSVMTHNLTNLPYKRNYRTNVKGELLTTVGNWKAEIDPDWGNGTDSGEIDHIIASSYTEVVNALQSSDKSDNIKVTVTQAAVNNLSDEEKEQVIVDETIDGSSVKALRFVLYEEKTEGEDKHPASPEHVEFELPARPSGVAAWKIEYEPEYPTETVVVSTKEEEDANVIIEAPKSTVTLDATKVNSVVSTTSENTLIIPQGLKLKNLTVKKGSVEYHGTGLTKVTVATAGEDKAYFKTSEGLANTDDVYGIVKDHVAPGYVIAKETENTWKIVQPVCKIRETAVAYASVSDAFQAVQDNQTIVMLQNDVLTKGQTITLEDKEAFTLDLNGKTISIAETGFDFTANGTNVALRNGVPVRFAIVVNGVGTMNICDNSTDKLGRIETKNNSYGTTKTILVDGNAVVNVNSGTVAADYAAFYVVGYTATGAVPVDAPKPTLNVAGGKIIGQQLGIGIKGNTATLKVTGGEIVGEEIYGVSTNGTQDWYDGGKFAIEITGGLIKSVAGNAMYLPAEGPTVITGGILEGATGIAVKGGSLSISENAIVKANGPFVEAHEVSSGNANTGSAIYVEDTYSGHKPFVNISGGKFSSVNNKAVEYFTNKADGAADKGIITLTGGIYSDKPAEVFVANQYIVAANDDATYPWKVELSPEAVTVARIGTTEYYSLSEALSAAKNGEAVYIIPAQLEETVSASNDNNIQLILDGKNIIGDIAFGGKGTLIVRAEELNTDYYHASKAYDVEAPTIPAQGVGGIMGKISATETATVMLRENLYSGPFEGNVELRGGFYYFGLGLDNIKARTPNGIGLVVDEIKNVQGYDMYYVPEVPESYLVHIQNVLELMAAYAEGKVSDEQINQITLGYGLGERILQPWWVSVNGGDASLSPSGDNYFPNDVYAFFTNLKDGEYDNPKYAYQDWYCDYVISYSEPIKKDYQSGIWGYYSNMSIGCWLPASVTQTPFAMLSAVNMKRTYSQMLSDVGMFLCGPVNLNPDDKGTVITVNLNIYPDSETDKCITTNKVVYTIPAISE